MRARLRAIAALLGSVAPSFGFVTRTCATPRASAANDVRIRYLQDARDERIDAGHRACLHQAWVRHIKPEDDCKRRYIAGLAGGYSRFISELVNLRLPQRGARRSTRMLPASRGGVFSGSSGVASAAT